MYFTMYLYKVPSITFIRRKLVGCTKKAAPEYSVYTPSAHLLGGVGGVHTTSLDPLPGSRCYLANPRKFLCFRLPAGLRASLMVQNTLHNREWEQKKGDSNSFFIHQIFFLLMNVTHQVWWATIHSSNLFFLL